jgi:hypothetical protein
LDAEIITKNQSALEAVILSGPWIKSKNDISMVSQWILGSKLKELTFFRMPAATTFIDDYDDNDSDLESSDGEKGEDPTVLGEDLTPSSVVSDYELLKELLNQIGEGNEVLRTITTDLCLSNQEIKALNMSRLSESERYQTDQCQVMLAGNTYLVRDTHPRL